MTPREKPRQNDGAKKETARRKTDTHEQNSAQLYAGWEVFRVPKVLGDRLRVVGRGFFYSGKKKRIRKTYRIVLETL